MIEPVVVEKVGRSIGPRSCFLRCVRLSSAGSPIRHLAGLSACCGGVHRAPSDWPVKDLREKNRARAKATPGPRKGAAKG
jgi:hypothetical protein